MSESESNDKHTSEDVTSGETAESAASIESASDEIKASPPDGQSADEPPRDEPTPALDEEFVLCRMEKKMEEGVERILAAFERKLAYDKHKEGQIDSLHSELQEHRRDIVAKTVRPLVTGMIQLHDDIGRTVEALQSKPLGEITVERLFRVVEDFQDDIEIVLAQNGVDVFRELGTSFEPRRQRALKTVPTLEPEQVGQVIRSLRPGFERHDEILQKERVEVYVKKQRVPEEESHQAMEAEESNG